MLLGSVIFQVGYPSFLYLTSDPDRRFAYCAMAFAALALFTFAGLTWVRIVNAALSGLLSVYLLVGLLRVIDLSGDRFVEVATILLLPILVAIIGYAACAVLLCHHSVHQWQTDVVQRRLAHQRMLSAARITYQRSSAESKVGLEACPWCGEIAVQPLDTECPACGRPV
jgi:hypothetical protein